ncbi:MAG: hypothetical protein Q9M31_01985 [Mariprofundus sp.]|nr:hypothetical protein [Mariprofundus sp.]
MNHFIATFRHLLVGLITLCVLTACATTTPKEDQRLHKLAKLHYQIGVDALSKGLLPKAFEDLMESNEILPNQPEVLDALAYAWLLRGELHKSEAFYIKALQHGGGAATQNNYANLLNKLKRYSDAEKRARASLADPRYPNQDLAFINLGDALLGQQKYPEAIDTFRLARQFNPRSNLINIRLASAYSKNGQSKQAEALYRSVIKLEPQNRLAVDGLLTLLIQQHQTRQAHELLYAFAEQTTSTADRAWSYDQLHRLDQGTNHEKSRN